MLSNSLILCYNVYVKIFDTYKLSKILMSLGLDDKEALTYLAALKTGGATIADLAEAVNIERTVIYYHIDKLLSLKLLKAIIRGKRTVYLPSDPERLKKIADERQKEFAMIFPTLEEQFSHQTSKSLIEYFEGPEELNKFYHRLYEILAGLKPPENHIYVFGQSYRTAINTNKIFLDFTPPKEQIKIKMRCILPKSQKSSKPAENAMDPYIVTRYNLPKAQLKYISDDYKYPGSTVIMNDRVVLHDFRNFTFSIVVNKNLATTWRMLFEFIWKHL